MEGLGADTASSGVILLEDWATEDLWAGMWPDVCLHLHSQLHALCGNPGTAYIFSLIPSVIAIYKSKNPSKQKPNKMSLIPPIIYLWGQTVLLRVLERWFVVNSLEKDLFLYKMEKRQSPGT